MPNIKFSKQEKIRFHDKLVRVLLKELFGEEVSSSAWISDMTELRDFSMDNPKNGILMDDGRYQFKYVYWDMKDISKITGKKYPELTKDEREQYKKERLVCRKKEELLFDKDIILTVKQSFGVEVSVDDINMTLVDLIAKIAHSMPDEYRKIHFKRE